ncbi:MAG: M23 family metallopeptidase [Anaerolineae bacterium]|nr:M23 family metallopeptidase [Anaerolineae bacterium]
MLFSRVDSQTIKILVGIALGLIVTAIIVVMIGMAQVDGISGIISTPTSTKTATSAETATSTPSATATATNTPSPTATPTATSTPTLTSTPTETSTSTPTATETPVPPTATFTPEPTIEPVTIEPEVGLTPVSIEAPLTTTVGISQSVSLTNTTVITPINTPTATFTPAPRSVQLPADLPNYRQVEDHFWFDRAFNSELSGWGSYYYPYGTNARGQYFWHYGIDIQAGQGTTILAVGDGVVTHADTDLVKVLGPWPDFYGQAVVIKHKESWKGLPVYTLYGHVSQVLVQPGQQVKSGDPIARVGQLGVALGPHLHLEVRVGAATYDDTRNPDLWVRPDDGFGVIAGRVVDSQGYLVPQQLVTLHRSAEGGRFWRQTFTYPDNLVNSDDNYYETFTFSDVPAGDYVVKTFYDGKQLTIPVTVKNQETSFVSFDQRTSSSQQTSTTPISTVASPVEVSLEETPTSGN